MREPRRHTVHVQPRRAVGLVVAAVLVASAAGASGFGVFQHGGRATGQVGAFTGRASDASAVNYNPAALTRLGTLEILGGIDFSAPRDDYDSATRGEVSADHIITFVPALYASWRPDEESPWALGIGIDSPMWYLADWEPVVFPGRFLTRRAEVTLLEVHPVVAYALDERWSVGGGVRWLRGTLGDGDVVAATFATAGGPATVEVERVAEGTADGYGVDFAVHFLEEFWGWGASVRTGIEVDGDGELDYTVRGGVPPAVASAYTSRFAPHSTGVQFELPPEARVGAWYAPYPELRLEADMALAMWSELDGSVLFLEPSPAPPVVRARNWDDTLSLRVAAEGDLTDEWGLFGGVAFEPSPVDDTSIEPGFPRGDAMVYGLGFSYRTPRVTFDVGYSFHDFESRGASRQELPAPLTTGTYSAHDQVFAASARWRF